MDGTDNLKDASAVAQDTSKGEQGTSTKTETLTKEQAQKMVSDALAKAGRDAKTLETKTAEAQKLMDDAKKANEDMRVKQEQWAKDRREAEIEASRDDKDALTSLRMKHKLEDEKAELARKERDVAEREVRATEALKVVEQTTREATALEIAIKHNVPYEKLLKFANTREQMEELALSLPRKDGQDPKTLKPDSGDGIGGGELSDEQKLKLRYPTMK